MIVQEDGSILVKVQKINSVVSSSSLHPCPSSSADSTQSPVFPCLEVVRALPDPDNETLESAIPDKVRKTKSKCSSMVLKKRDSGPFIPQRLSIGDQKLGRTLLISRMQLDDQVPEQSRWMDDIRSRETSNSDTSGSNWSARTPSTSFRGESSVRLRSKTEWAAPTQTSADEPSVIADQSRSGSPPASYSSSSTGSWIPPSRLPTSTVSFDSRPSASTKVVAKSSANPCGATVADKKVQVGQIVVGGKRLSVKFVAAEALFDFEGENDFELSFKRGEELQVYSIDEITGWWQGGKRGILGYFPGSFVRLEVELDNQVALSLRENLADR